MTTAAGLDIDRDAATRVASVALGQPATEVECDARPLVYSVLNPVSQGLYRITGSARVDGAARQWSSVLKICRRPTEEHLARVPPEWRDVYLRFLRWDREADAYASGLLERLPEGVTAPRCFGVDREEATAWVWLEDVREEQPSWSLERYGLAARHLGRLNASRFDRSAAWFSRELIRHWSDYFSRTTKAILDDERVWSAPAVLNAFAPTAREVLRTFHASRHRWLDALDALPLTFSHVDAFRANMLSRTRDGRVETVLLDWAFVGEAPIAADAAQLVVASIFYHGDALDPEVLEAEVLNGYRLGLQDAGITKTATELARAYAINAVARWALPIAWISVAGDKEREAAVARASGRPYEDVLAQLAGKTRYLAALSQRVDLD
jgi:hypothetical protein